MDRAEEVVDKVDPSQCTEWSERDVINHIVGGAITSDFRAPGLFDPEQPAPPDASPADKLLAFAGRKV